MNYLTGVMAALPSSLIAVTLIIACPTGSWLETGCTVARSNATKRREKKPEPAQPGRGDDLIDFTAMVGMEEKPVKGACAIHPA